MQVFTAFGKKKAVTEVQSRSSPEYIAHEVAIPRLVLGKSQSWASSTNMAVIAFSILGLNNPTPSLPSFREYPSTISTASLSLAPISIACWPTKAARTRASRCEHVIFTSSGRPALFGRSSFFPNFAHFSFMQRYHKPFKLTTNSSASEQAGQLC